ncbi:hypothetical protein IDG70_07780, partial [Staphylococcus sp. EG-SA-26]|nr:hypothetical protein [Staphylococcus sp. EG-SA-26]
RTVFSKALNIYLKLPIHVKITNFIRTNDLEQIERTIDAAQVIVIELKLVTQYTCFRICIFNIIFQQPMLGMVRVGIYQYSCT